MFTLEARIHMRARAHKSRINAGHIDPVFMEFGSHRVRKACQGELAHRIWSKMWNRDLPSDRRNVDNPSAPLLAHVRNRCKHRMKRRPGMGGYCVLEVLKPHMLQWSDLYNARIVNEHINRSEFANRELNGFFGFMTIADIARQDSHRCAHAGQFFLGGFEGFLVTADNR